MAFEVLSYYYQADKDLAPKVVAQELPLWGFKNVLTLAANGDCRRFLAHPCCQTVLSNIWYGKVSFSFLEGCMRER